MIYGPDPLEGEQRYSPPVCTGTKIDLGRSRWWATIPSTSNDDPDNIDCEESSSSGDSGGGGDSDNDTPSGSVDSAYGPVAPAREADAPLPLAIVCGGLGLLGLVGLRVARTRRAG